MTDEPTVDPVLRAAVLELEAHADSTGWDLPGRLFALVDTAALVRDEPDLAAQMGIDADGAGYTAIEQEQLGGQELEEVLLGIEWPAAVDGCAVVVERMVLPPEVEDLVPDDPDEAAAFAVAHPDASEVRIVAAVVRDGGSHCAMRIRTPDTPVAVPLPVIEGADLVPTLLELLASTLTGPTPGPPD